MFNRRTCLQSTAAFALTLVVGFAEPSFADGFDTSGIKIDPALAERLPEKIKKAGVITIGSDTAYAPWEYLRGCLKKS